MSESNNDEIESAKILIQENLFEEAKHVLFRLLTHIKDSQSHSYRVANELLKKIEKIELNQFMNSSVKHKKEEFLEDSDSLILQLEKNLQLNSFEKDSKDLEIEKWSVNEPQHSTQVLFDLAVAFYEMECFADALRELKRAEKKIRIEDSFLGELGVSVVALKAQALIKMGSSFNAKIYLEPILLEDDLRHEQKIILYYSMGLATQDLQEKDSAKGWFLKVAEFDPEFKDVQQRIRTLSKQT